MSNFRLFMKENKAKKENGKYAPTVDLLDENNQPLEWEFRRITSKENDIIRDACSTEVPITGKPNMYRQKFNASQYLAKLIATSTVYPDLFNSELQNSYGVMSPEELLFAIVDDAGEYQELGVWIQKFQGFTKTFDEKVTDAKN